jgi:hypothetical protein
MHTMDVALHASGALVWRYETASFSHRQRRRFVLKRRLHQYSIVSAFGRAEYLATKQGAPMALLYDEKDFVQKYVGA